MSRIDIALVSRDATLKPVESEILYDKDFSDHIPILLDLQLDYKRMDPKKVEGAPRLKTPRTYYAIKWRLFASFDVEVGK